MAMLHEFGLGRTIEATRIEDDRKKAMCIARCVTPCAVGGNINAVFSSLVRPHK